MSFLRHRRSIHPIWKEQTIYAHYASKEDLFLALMDQRVLTKFSAVTEAIEAESNIAKRPAIFRRFLACRGYFVLQGWCESRWQTSCGVTWIGHSCAWST